MTATLERTTFKTSRLLEFCSEKELTAQIGHERGNWPLVVGKELIDNALDACEETGVAPQISVVVNGDGITVIDNGSGIPRETVEGSLDYKVCVSNREAYASPTRGHQGNALKTILAMPFVLDGDRGRVEITARGLRHEVSFGVNHIRQEPDIRHTSHRDENVKSGTKVTVFWPDSALLDVGGGQEPFLTFGHGLHVLESAPETGGQLVRRDNKHGSHYPDLAEVAAQRSYVASLV